VGGARQPQRDVEDDRDAGAGRDDERERAVRGCQDGDADQEDDPDGQAKGVSSGDGTMIVERFQDVGERCGRWWT
jgi:hypothetical protein